MEFWLKVRLSEVYIVTGILDCFGCGWPEVERFIRCFGVHSIGNWNSSHALLRLVNRTPRKTRTKLLSIDGLSVRYSLLYH